MENQNINVNEVEFEGGANSTEQIKTYTQEEVNELLKGYKSQEEVNNIVNKRLAREKKDIEARIEAEKREAERLATMSAEEKAKHELEKRMAELEAREREIAKKELENETSRQLKDLGISINATKFVLGESAETTHSNIKDFANFIEELKEDLKRELLKGKTPRTSVSVTGNVITKEQFKRMSYMEKMDLYNKDIELFNKLNQ